MARVKVVRHKRGWDELVENIIDNDAVPRLERVADACNAVLEAHGHDDSEGKGYRVSSEGTDPLTKRRFRATVITATAPAMAHDQEHETLLKNMHLAEG